MGFEILFTGLGLRVVSCVRAKVSSHTFLENEEEEEGKKTSTVPGGNKNDSFEYTYAFFECEATLGRCSENLTV